MNSRILRNIWRLNNIYPLGQISFIVSRSYATPIDHSVRFPVQQLLLRNYTTRGNLKEKTSPALSLDQVLGKLQADFAAHGNVHPGNFQRLLDSLEAGGTLTSEQSAFLLEACADLMPSTNPDFRMQLFEKLWEHLKANGGLKKQQYITLLRVYAANRVSLGNFRKFLEDSGVKDDPEMYEKLIQYACELGDVKLTAEIFAEMKEKGFALTENVFNALILGNSRNKDLKGALEVLETMNAAGVRLSSATYTQLAAAYMENNDFKKAAEIIQQHTGQFNLNQTVGLMKTLTNAGQSANQELMGLLVKQLPGDFLNAKEVPNVIRNLCTELIHTGRVDEASNIIAALPCPKFNENQDIDTFGVSFLQDIFRSKVSHEKIIDVAKSLIKSGKNLRALHIACDSAMRRNPEQAIPYLEALSDIEALRPHYFWPLLLHRFRHNGEAGILKVLKVMSKLGVDCDYETLSFYVLPRLSVTLDNAQQAIKTLEECGLKTSQTLTPIIAHLIFQQKLDDVISIAQLYTSKLDTKQFIHPMANLAVSTRANRRYHKLSNVLHILHLKSEDAKIDFVGQVLLEATGNNKVRNDSVFLPRVITELSRLGTRMSPAAVEVIGGRLARGKSNEEDLQNIQKILTSLSNSKLSLPTTENASSQIAHPRDMTYDQLECHLVELEAKGLNTRGVLRRLLQICVRDGRLERALQIKKKCDEAGVEMSPGMMACIFDLHIKLKDIAAAEASYKHLLKAFPGFLLDEHKLIDFAALMVHENRLEDAKKFLADRAASRKVFGGEYVIKNVWYLLTNVARLAAKTPDIPKEKNLTKEVFFFMKKLGYCGSHNAILGPIIREYIYRKDIRSAVAEFKTLAEIFRHTPLQFELSSILVSLSNSSDPDNFNVSPEEAKELLQQLTTTVSSVHGVVNMNSSLLLAVAESGNENQLRKLLINPEFRVNHEMLNQNCEHLNEEGSIQTLLRLAKACRGLGHVIKEQDVYNMLLMKFVSDNNYRAAIDLFEKLEADDDLKMSQDFLKNLVNLLKVNKIELPSSLALRAQIM